MTEETAKSCFVIAPIGEDGSDTRIRSDQVLKHLILPACQKTGYKPIRADEISEPGIITSQIIQHVVDDALVIADITGRNPNVFYELAIRHAIRKPVVQLIHAGETIPFDVAHQRTIKVDHKDLDSAAACVEELTRQIQSAERDPSKVDTPISMALEVQTLRQSENPLEKSTADMIVMLQDIRSAVSEISERNVARVSPRSLEELALMLDRIDALVSLPPDAEPERARFDEASAMVRRTWMILEHFVAEAGLDPDPILFRRRRRPRRE